MPLSTDPTVSKIRRVRSSAGLFGLGEAQMALRQQHSRCRWLCCERAAGMCAGFPEMRGKTQWRVSRSLLQVPAEQKIEHYPVQSSWHRQSDWEYVPGQRRRLHQAGASAPTALGTQEGLVGSLLGDRLVQALLQSNEEKLPWRCQGTSIWIFSVPKATEVTTEDKTGG